jgi:hypothetical protein
MTSRCKSADSYIPEFTHDETKTNTEPHQAAPMTPQAQKNLLTAIEAIPGRGTVPFETFLLATLGVLAENHRKAGLGTVEIHPTLWMGRPTEIPIEPCRAAVEAYVQAVRDHAPFTDVLGAIHARTISRSGGEELGQSFTPMDLQDLTGALAKRLSTPGLKRIQDVCCGSGGLTLGVLRSGAITASNAIVHAVDIDPVCCAMTSVQLMVQGFAHHQPVRRVRVYCANALHDPNTWLCSTDTIGRTSRSTSSNRRTP